MPKTLLRRHRMPSVPPSGGISTTERALSWYGKARSATQKRLFHDTGKPVRQHERGSSAAPERLVCGTGKVNRLCVSTLRECLKKPRICNRNASCARKRQYCRLTVAYLCISVRDTVYLCKRIHARMTGILPHAGHCQYDARYDMYAAVTAQCSAAVRHLHKRKKACSGKAGTCHAFHISCLVITSEERRTSPGGQLLWWHQQTCRQALRS